jgi:hypothetical protein
MQIVIFKYESVILLIAKCLKTCILAMCEVFENVHSCNV